MFSSAIYVGGFLLPEQSKSRLADRADLQFTKTYKHQMLELCELRRGSKQSGMAMSLCPGDRLCGPQLSNAPCSPAFFKARCIDSCIARGTAS
jgi:hypothetical protein